MNENGERLYIVMKPWANDSAGKSLKTWYTIEKKGTVLRQNIDLKDASFPVVADPVWCGNTIESATWKSYINGDDRGTLSIIPTWCGRNLNVSTSSVWYELQNRFWTQFTIAASCNNLICSSTKLNSLWNQLSCHKFGGIIKPDWNLEAWRRIVSW